jgi:hypothetical protein
MPWAEVSHLVVVKTKAPVNPALEAAVIADAEDDTQRLVINHFRRTLIFS